jgi:dolichol-phosphate mannosyltransferase
MADVLILIPTYNERENVEPLTQAVREALPEADLLFLDDASPDGTGEVLDRLAGADPKGHVLHREAKLGLGAAYLAGFAWSLERAYTSSICMDADFSHDPRDLPRLIERLEDHDLVAGSRYMPGGAIRNWAVHRRILSYGGRVYARWLTRMPFTDPTGGFNGYRNEMLKQLELRRVDSKGYSFQIEMKHLAWKSGFRWMEFPIVFTERRHGRSKMSTGIIREALRLVKGLKGLPR